MATKKKKAPRKGTKAPKVTSSPRRRAPLTPKALQAVRKAAEALWDAGAPPHLLLGELHDSILLRCLEEAKGNYAAAADLFGPSRQSVQQYANSPLRDSRWKSYQQNRRKTSSER